MSYAGITMKIGEKNVGMLDRIARIIIGLALFGFGLLYAASPWSYIVMLLGLIALATGALGTCGIYSLLGINTLKGAKR